MNTLFKMLLCGCFLLMKVYASAQNDTIFLSPSQVEDIFMKQNLQLIAEKLNIDIAEAAVVQAKLWPNPNFTLDQVNLWATDSQRNGEDEIIPPLFGSFGKNTEFAASLEQVIILGGKRRKLVDMEKVSRDIAVQYFEELLRSLKAELRNACIEMSYLQDYQKVLKSQKSVLDALILNYREQAKKGNVSQSQLLRLQAALLELGSGINEVRKEVNLQQKNLKALLNLPTPAYIVLTPSPASMKDPGNLSYSELTELAMNTRPDMKEAIFRKDYSEKSLCYEKSQRVPDLTFLASYDREGNCMRDFVGFGVSIDLPFFNRNQGNIKAARISLEQNRVLADHKQVVVYGEVTQALQNYTLAYRFNQQITNEFISNLDDILESYTRNFVNRNIGILEFLDFFEVCKDNKRTILSAHKDVRVSYEELQYVVGTELSSF